MKVLKGLKVILIGILLMLVFNHAYSQQITPMAVGRVVWVKGGSFKAIMPSKEVRVLQKTSPIYLYDRLITDGGTQAEVVFTDDTLITYHPNTEFQVDEYSFKKDQKGSSGRSVMSIIQGGFRTITGIIAKNNPDEYAVKTPVATIGVRGTDYTVQLKDGELYIGFNHGVPCVKSNKAAGELCLDKNTPYARVASASTPPEGLKQKPAALKDNVEVTPAKIAGFGSTGSSSKSGTVTSFCIMQ